MCTVHSHELFVSYGDHWFLERAKDLGHIPVTKDYPRAQRLINSMYHKLSGDEDKQYPHVISDIWDFILSTVDNERIKALLPSLKDLPGAVNSGLSRFHLPDVVRSQQWLKENSMCVDNIKPGPSNIPQAGRGAFATRFLEKDSIVAPAPVLALNRTEVSRSRQLLVNYGYGNHRSSVLLVTYGPILNFINHDSQNPNVRLQWSTHPYHKEEMLKTPPKKLFQKGFGMLMELVALRDIDAGEEILMDYGSEWEEAWKNFIANWTAPPDSEEYVISFELNNDALKDGATYHVLRDAEEQKLNPYPKSVLTACFYQATSAPPQEQHTAQTADGEKVIVQVTWSGPRSTCLRPCQILSREETANGKGKITHFYTAEMMGMLTGDDEDCVLNPNQRHIVSRIPRAAVSFIHSPGSSDQNLQNTFRHPLELSDSIWPKAWMDIEEPKSETISPE